MKISLLHPSRNRAAMADAAVAEWKGKLSGLHSIEYLVSIDESDGQIGEYRRLEDRQGVRLVVRPNQTLVQACNQAARVATGDLLIMVSDDTGCPLGWDEALARAVGNRFDAAVLVDDGLGAKTIAVPIVGRAFYEARGYLLFPGYRHHFSQNDLEGVARGLGKLIDARHLLFPHRHFTAGASGYDETYRNSDRSWRQGAHLLRKRQVRAFDLRRPKIGEVATCCRLELDYRRGVMQALLLRGVRRVKARFRVIDSIRTRLRNLARVFRECPSRLRRSLRRFGRNHEGRASAGPAPDAGRLFGDHCYVRAPDVRGDVMLLDHAAARSRIVCIRDCVVDRTRVRVRPGGGEIPVEFVPEEWEYAAFEPGSLQVRDLGGLSPSRLLGYQRRLLSGAERVGTLRHDREEPVTTVAIERREHFNFYHAITELFNAHSAIRLLVRDEPFDILFLDGHCRSPLDALWRDILRPSRIRRLHDSPGEAIRFRKLILVAGGYESPLWGSGKVEPSRPGDLLSDFIDAVLAAYPDADRPSGDPVLTFVDRRDYRPHPQSDGITTRKVDDLDFTVGLLRRLYPRHRVDVRSFEDMPFAQQLQIVRTTDVLCGVHGAALTHVLFLRPGSELVEFTPAEACRNDIFKNLAGFRAIRFTRYFAQTVRVPPNRKTVVRVTETRL